MIRLSDPIKQRLSAIKGSSFDQKIELMLDYFDSTGSNPSKRIANPIFEVERQVERVVKILQNIENKKIDKILKIIEDPRLFSKQKIGTEKSQFSEEELAAINDLGETIKIQKEEIAQLENKLSKSVQQTETVSNQDSDQIKRDLQVIKDTINDLEESKRSTQIDTASYLLNKNIFNNAIKKMVTIINTHVR